MNEARFVADREAGWRELAVLLGRARGGAASRLRGDDIRRVAALYRAACADLATARTLGLSPNVEERLNHLCALAHGVIYSEGRARPAGRLVELIAHECPRAVRATLRWHLGAAAIVGLAAAATYVVLRAHPDLADQAFGPTLRTRAERAAAQAAGDRRYLDVSGIFAPFLSYGLMVNNILVTLLAFGAGAACVVPGVVILLFNGVILGAGVAVFADRGVADVILTFIAAHGPMELTAIFLGAGAGMHVGSSWMLPGRRTRAASFIAAAKNALAILLGATLLLVAAGLIEGHLSPSGAPSAAKLAVGAVTGALTAAWLALGGRGTPAATAPRGP